MPSLLSEQVIALLYSEPRFSPVNELRLHIDGRALGWVRPRVAEALCQLDRQRIRVNTRDIYLNAGSDPASRSRVLQAWAMALRENGVLANWRDEAMQLDQPDGTFLRIERAAFRTLGLCTPSVHLNGWVALPDGVHLDYWNDRSKIVKGRIDLLERSLPLKYTQDFDPATVTPDIGNRSESFGKLMAMAVMKLEVGSPASS